jgi:hypothetical protein
MFPTIRGLGCGGGSDSSGGQGALVSAFSEFLVPVVFTSFKPFLLREKRVPPTLVIIRRLGFQSPFFTQIKTSSFHRLFFLFLFLSSVGKI